MHVAINAHLLNLTPGYRSAGISRYIHCLLRGLDGVATPDRFTVYCGPQARPGTWAGSGALSVATSRWSTARPVPRILWEQACQPARLLSSPPDVTHSLAFVSPVFWPGPTVVTIYDLSFLLFPDRFNTANRTYLTAMTRLSARRAHRIVAISQSTKSDIVRLLGIPPDRIDVVPPALEPDTRAPDPGALAEFRCAHGLPERFILYLGTLEPRKNVTTLIEAFRRLRGRLPEHRLVLAGGSGWGCDDIAQAIHQGGFQKGDILLPGFVPEAELNFWYAAADVFCYPSSYEGFGLPVLEALACRTPVVCSNVSSLPEAAGGAALLVPPGDAEALAQAISRLIDDEDLRDELGQRGLDHAASFTISAMARQMKDVYARAIAAA